MGIYSIKKVAQTKAKGRDKGAGVGIRAAYLRVVGIEVDTEGAGEHVGKLLFFWLKTASLFSHSHVLLTVFQAVEPLVQFLLRRKRSWGLWLPLPPSMTPSLALWPRPSTAAMTWRKP